MQTPGLSSDRRWRSQASTIRSGVSDVCSFIAPLWVELFERRDAGHDGGFRIATKAAIEVRIDAALVRETNGVAVRTKHSECVGESERPPPIASTHVADQTVGFGMRSAIIGQKLLPGADATGIFRPLKRPRNRIGRSNSRTAFKVTR
jgi:hypothetical protein